MKVNWNVSWNLIKIRENITPRGDGNLIAFNGCISFM